VVVVVVAAAVAAATMIELKYFKNLRNFMFAYN